MDQQSVNVSRWWICNFLFQANQQASSEPSIDVQNLQDQLIASKMREAEANLSTRELEQKVNELEKYWQVNVKFIL